MVAIRLMARFKNHDTFKYQSMNDKESKGHDQIPQWFQQEIVCCDGAGHHGDPDGARTIGL